MFLACLFLLLIIKTLYIQFLCGNQWRGRKFKKVSYLHFMVQTNLFLCTPFIFTEIWSERKISFLSTQQFKIRINHSCQCSQSN